MKTHCEHVAALEGGVSVVGSYNDLRKFLSEYVRLRKQNAVPNPWRWNVTPVVDNRGVDAWTVGVRPFLAVTSAECTPGPHRPLPRRRHTSQERRHRDRVHPIRRRNTCTQNWLP